jgi:hypothetical protein
MTEVVLKTDDDEYYEIFSSSLFNGKMKRPLNWLEESDRRQKKKSTEKEETDE